MATPGTPTANGGTATAYSASTPDLIVSAFRTMLTHISELFTLDNASSLAYINGLPSPAGNTPHKPLDVLMELEKRGVFSHENIDPLISLLTDLHRVDIINTCGVREYKDKAEQTKLMRGDSSSSMVMKLNGMGESSGSRHQSVDLTHHDAEYKRDKFRSGSESKSDNRAGSGMGQRTLDTGYSQLQQQSSLVSGTASPRTPCSTSSSEECLQLTSTPSPTASTQKLGGLSTAEIIAELASDPQAVSLMREVVTKGEATNTGNDTNTVHAAGNELQCPNTGEDPTISKDEVRKDSEGATSNGGTGHQADDLPSPPIELKSLEPSKVLYQRQTSSISTQTDEEMSLSLTQAAAIGSLASSRDTESTSGYDSMQGSVTKGGHPNPVLGSLILQDDVQPPSPPAASMVPQQASPQGSGDATISSATHTTKPASPRDLKSSSSKQVPEFDTSIDAVKLTWKVKRLALCELICKHSSKDITKELKLSNSARQCTPRRNRRSAGDPVKLTFHLYPHGFGRDEGSFMSIRVCVRVDPKMQLKDMATVHLKITTRLPPGEFVTVRTTANSLEDFIINDFIPHDIIINQGSKNVEFLIEAYLTYDSVQADVSDKELMESLTVIDDDNAAISEGFMDVGDMLAQ